MVLSLSMGAWSLAWANVYLVTGSELGFVNYDILRRVALMLRTLACPLVIAGGFSCSASAIEESGSLGLSMLGWRRLIWERVCRRKGFLTCSS